MDLAIYARRSRPEELEPGDQETSTERQVTDCRKLADLKGWHVPEWHIYREAGVSGYTGKRRDASAALSALWRLARSKASSAGSLTASPATAGTWTGSSRWPRSGAW